MSRRIGAGFLAGASSVASLLVLIAALVFGAGIFGLIRDVSSGVFGDISLSAAMAQSMGSSLATIPQYFWSARWSMLALGVTGIVLALADMWREYLSRPWRDSLGYIVANGMSGVVVFSSLYLNNDTIFRTIAEQPNLYSIQATLLVSDWTMLSIGVLATLGLGYVVWAAWVWWYDLWARWLRVERPLSLEASREVAAPTSSPDDWRTYQDRLMRLKRQDQSDGAVETAVAPVSMQRSWIVPLGATVVVISLVVFALLRSYHGASTALMSGEFWLETSAPVTAFRIDFYDTPRSMTFSNTGGTGSVDIRISDSKQTLKTLDSMALAGGPGFSSQSLDLNGLEAGAYRVDAELKQGAGGQIRYVGLYGGGWTAQLLAGFVGIMCALWIVSVHLFILEMLTRRGLARLP